MTSIIFTNMVLNESIEYSKHSLACMNREDLGDYILRVIKEDNLSYRAIVERAERKGFKITHSYISKIVSGAATNPSVDKLQALAAGLNRPQKEVFAVARGDSLEEEEINDALMNALAFNYGKLSKKDREEIAPILRMLKRDMEERLDKAANK